MTKLATDETLSGAPAAILDVRRLLTLVLIPSQCGAAIG
jgi:hypothetical protein